MALGSRIVVCRRLSARQTPCLVPSCSVKMPRCGIFTRSPAPSGNPEVHELHVRYQKKSTQKGCFSFLGAEAGFEPRDLRVMSPTS